MKIIKIGLSTPLLTCAGALALALGMNSGVALAEGDETLGTPAITIAQGTDFVSEGVSVQDGPAVVELNVPPGASIQQVLLYWGEIRAGAAGANADKLKVDGTTIQGVPIGNTDRSHNFRADITAQGFVAPGNNMIELASLQADGGVQGAAVLVIYNAGSVAGSGNPFGYGGSALGARAKVGSITTSVVSAGPLPASGGVVEPDPVNSTRIGSLGAASTVSARTVGTGSQTRSTAAVEDLGISLAGVGIGASAINSEATATCTSAGARVGGGSVFADLSVAGLHLPISFPPNTVVLNLGVIRVVANQQSSSGNGNSKSITVTGLRVTSSLPLFKGTDVQIASATASISCESAIASSQIRIRDGSDFDFRNFAGPLAFTVLQSFDIAPSAVDRTYSPTFFVTDGDRLRPDVTEFYIDDVLQLTVNDEINESDGHSTDVDTFGPITVPAGATRIGFRPTSAISPGSEGLLPDSMNWVFAAFKLDGMPPPSRLYSGRATVLNAAVAGLSNVAVSDTGELPALGGDLSDAVADVAVPSLLGSITGSAATVGAGDQTDSSASVEQLDVTVLGIGVSADLIETSASAVCTGAAPSTAGSTNFTNLVVNGIPISVDLPTEISLPLGATLFIDEQVVSASGNSESIQVNALRLNVPNPVSGEPDLANVVISASRAGITCN